ncbi:Exc2 family lipoprotein [Salmonella enterica]|nr:Exc2 family lipoprotein [Salmonella enterica]EIL4052067.1 Exc2 family lipoprotein [Salmonella enterica]EIL4070399.1 Exc2 family lipoprotein [Salmonella enterica]
MLTRRHLPLVFFIPLFLAACSGNQTSVEKHARHLARQMERDHFDPNMRPLTADNTRLAARFLSQFYEMGKKDRAAGLTTAQAQQRVNSFSADGGPFAPEAQKSTFINQTYAAEQPEKRSNLLKQGAVSTYWDGYNGRP